MNKNNFTNGPKVSIIIPVYNGGNFLRRAIDSALNQTYFNIEVIVVNDGSSDCGITEGIALSYGDRIKYYKKNNYGVASALNYGIEKMEGEFFCWLSHDDEYAPKKVEEELKELINPYNKNLIVMEFPKYINEDGDCISEGLDFDEFISKGCFFEKKWIKLFFLEEINGNGLMFHKELFEKYGLFNEELKTTQDYDFWFRIMRKVPIRIINKKNVYSRQHSMQGSKILNIHKKEKEQFWLNVEKFLSLQEIAELGNGSILEGHAWLYKFFKDDKEMPMLSKKYRDLMLNDFYRITGVRISSCFFPVRRSYVLKRKEKFEKSLLKIKDKGLLLYLKEKF